MTSEHAAGLIVVLVIGAVIGLVWATHGLMGVFWGVVSIAAIWVVYWTVSHFVPRPRRTRDHRAAGVRPPGARPLVPGGEVVD